MHLSPPRKAVLLLGALSLAGCGASPTVAPSASAGTKLLEAGGRGADVTSVFEVNASDIRIDYRLSGTPTNHQIGFALERDGGSGTFEEANRTSETVPDALAGSKTLPTIPGRYRLRVDTDVTWSAMVYEVK